MRKQCGYSEEEEEAEEEEEEAEEEKEEEEEDCWGTGGLQRGTARYDVPLLSSLPQRRRENGLRYMYS